MVIVRFSLCHFWRSGPCLISMQEGLSVEEETS